VRQLPPLPGETGPLRARMAVAALTTALMFVTMIVGREFGRICLLPTAPWAVVTVVGAGVKRCSR